LQEKKNFSGQSKTPATIVFCRGSAFFLRIALHCYPKIKTNMFVIEFKDQAAIFSVLNAGGILCAFYVYFFSLRALRAFVVKTIFSSLVAAGRAASFVVSRTGARLIPSTTIGLKRMGSLASATAATRKNAAR